MNTMSHTMKHLGCHVALMCALGGFATAQGDATALYTCAVEPPSVTDALSLTLCDAAPTEAFSSRADTDNLQERRGALVLDLDADGIAAVAGFETGDVIYRVGGVDVADAHAAADQLQRVQTEADTVVNFLRGGRPYRIKLRRE